MQGAKSLLKWGMRQRLFTSWDEDLQGEMDKSNMFLTSATSAKWTKNSDLSSISSHLSLKKDWFRSQRNSCWISGVWNCKKSGSGRGISFGDSDSDDRNDVRVVEEDGRIIFERIADCESGWIVWICEEDVDKNWEDGLPNSVASFDNEGEVGVKWKYLFRKCDEDESSGGGEEKEDGWTIFDKIVDCEYASIVWICGKDVCIKHGDGLPNSVTSFDNDIQWRGWFELRFGEKVGFEGTIKEEDDTNVGGGEKAGLGVLNDKEGQGWIGVQFKEQKGLAVSTDEDWSAGGSKKSRIGSLDWEWWALMNWKNWVIHKWY